ncbi:hypothetical protein BWD121_000900 [Bartonella sp. WD12.1]|nr:hypothetical protein BWD121_000900 [Bartonella sp. WD12.1]
MRRVLKHHVCFCFLSTALLAGVSLIAAQEKVYAQSQGNCRVAAVGGDGSDNGEQPIVCGGSEGRLGVSVSDGRTIDMDKYPGWPAVEVRGGDTNITMGGMLRVTNTGDRGSSGRNEPAIKVHGGGKLKLMEATIVDVHKGIVADGGFVTVMAGSIKIKDGGDAVIEVSKGGRVTLMMKGQGVRGGGSNSTGIVMDGGGTVVLDGTNFTQVTTGIMIKGNGGKASVNMGEGKITVGSSGRGIVMQGQGEASATVMGGEIVGSGSVVGAEVSSGTLTLMGTSFTKVTMGAEVKGDGKLKMTEGKIVVTSANGGTGLSVGGTGKASATVTNVKIVGKGDGSGDKGTGVVMMGDGEVMLMGTTVESFLTGVEMKSGTSGTVTVTGGTKIVTTVENGVGIKVEGGTLKINGESTIEAKGQKAVGIKITEGNGSVTMMGGKIEGKGDGSGQGIGVDMAGDGTVTLTSVGVEGFETGVKVSKGKVTISGESAITARGKKAVGVQITETGKAEVIGATIEGGGDWGTVLKVEGQGKAELKDVTIVGKGNGGNKGVEVDTLSEEGVKLTNVEIEGVTTGVSVSKGKVMISGESTITAKGGGTGLSVSGMGEVTMMGGKIEGSVSVSGTGNAELKDVEISKATTGVSVTSGKFVMRRGKITGSERGSGVDISGKGEVTLEEVDISKVGYGVSVSEGASGTLTVKKGSIKGFTGTGVSVEEGAVVVNVDGTKIMGKGSGTSKGVSVGSSVTGAVTLKDVTVSEVATGVQMLGGKKLTMERGSITVVENGVGVSVEGGEEVTVNLDGTKITGSGTSRNGVYVGSSVTGAVTLKDVTISEVATGVYVKSGATKAELTLTGVTIEVVEKGVQMLGGKKLVMERGSIGFTRSYGVNVGGEMTQLTKTVITGSGEAVNSGVSKGVYATGGEVTLTDVTISQVATGVSMMGGGTLMMTKGEIKEFTTEGVNVGISVISAELKGTVITGKGSGTGVKVSGGKVGMTLADVTVSGVQTGVEMNGTGALMISGSSTIEFTSDNGYGVYVGSSVTRAELTKTVIRGEGNGSEYGVYVAHGGKVGMKYEGNNADATFLKVDATEGANKADIKGALIKIDGQGKGLGVHVMNGGRVMLKNTVLANVVKGVDIFLESMFHLFLRLLSVSCVMCVCIVFFTL